MGVRGPLARNPEDLKLAMLALGGPDADESVAWSWSMPSARCARTSEYRVGFVFDDRACPVSAEARVALDAAVAALIRAGAKVEEGWPSSLIPEHQYNVYRFLSLRRKASRLPGSRGALKLSKLADEMASEASEGGWDNLKKQLFSSKGAVAAARCLWREYFQTHDAFLLPNTFVPAFPHDHVEPREERWLQTSEGPQPYLNLPFWVSFATLAGLPATSAPVGFTPSGLPVGIQIIGPYLEDATPIDLAGRLADLIGGFRLPEI
jgi:amidase